MKFITLFTLVLIAFVGYTSAQLCVPSNPTCTGALNVGRRGRGCNRRTMWYFNTQIRRCLPMNYLGCGGNNNRYCTWEACRQRCM